jgi:hypothetical protein
MSTPLSIKYKNGRVEWDDIQIPIPLASFWSDSLRKYGKCNYCQKGEGKFVKGAGALANPGGAGGCSKDGGKCMFKYLASNG